MSCGVDDVSGTGAAVVQDTVVPGIAGGSALLSYA